MKRTLCLLIVLTLCLPVLAAAESGWANKNLPAARTPEPIEIVPWEEISGNKPWQHHYLLLCIDKWDSSVSSRPRPEDFPDTPLSEGRGRDNFGNTDGIVILTLDTAAHRIMMCSVVRDALVLKPGSTAEKPYYGRINYVYNDFGANALCRLISEHLGIQIEKYILFNFSQVQDIIDLEALDGVDIELRRDEEYDEVKYLANYAVPRHSVVKADGYYALKGDPMELEFTTPDDRKLYFSIPASVFTETKNGYVADTQIQSTSGEPLSLRPNNNLTITLKDGTAIKGYYSYEHGRLAIMTGTDLHLNTRAPAGLYHMNGHAALLYMRIRKAGSTDTDFMRTQRVRNVLSKLADKCRSFTLDQANELANSIMQHNISTNMTLKDMTDAATLAYGLRDCTIEEFRVPPQADVRSITFAQMSALEINWASVRAKYLDFLDHTTLVRDIDFLVDD